MTDADVDANDTVCCVFSIICVPELWDFYIDDIVYVHVHVNAIKTIIFVQIKQHHEHYYNEYNVSNLREAFKVIV